MLLLFVAPCSLKHSNVWKNGYVTFSGGKVDTGGAFGDSGEEKFLASIPVFLRSSRMVPHRNHPVTFL